METQYFQLRAELLKKKVMPEPERKLGFMELKAREYWVRTTARYPKLFHSENFLPLFQGQEFLEMLEVYAKALGKGDTEDGVLLAAREHCADMLKCARKEEPVDLDYLFEILKDLNNKKLVRSMAGVTRCFRQQCLESLAQADIGDDPVAMRVNDLRAQFCLDEGQVEIVLAAWLVRSQEHVEKLYEQLKVKLPGNGFQNDSSRLLQILTGLSPADMQRHLALDGRLLQLGILDSELDLENDIMEFLEGRVIGNLQERYFKKWEGPVVPLHDLRPHDAEVDLMVAMLRHCPHYQGLHILFHGVEGSGKTELAHALALQLELPLYKVGENLPTPANTDKALLIHDRVLRYRLRALHVALNQAAVEPCLLLLDEADTLLAQTEKGVLNQLLEKAQARVIWITNSLNWVERSTLRRFDYALRFGPLDARQRMTVWESVTRSLGAVQVLKTAQLETLAREIPVQAGGAAKAIRHARDLAAACSMDSMAVARRVAESQARLLDLPMETLAREKGMAALYDARALNIQGDQDEVCETVRHFYAHAEKQDNFRGTLGILLWGAPGTGKTEFASYLARENGRELVVVRASDVLGPYVGETEAKIRDMFRSAEERKAILFIDEADSLLRSRSGAMQSWEVSQVNEMLVRMERYAGVLLAATNFPESLDVASRRRFALRLGFDYLRPQGVRLLWERFFPEATCEDSVARLSMLAPGDFAAVYHRLRYLPGALADGARIARELRCEAEGKDEKAHRSMGFCAKEAC